ncbi:MAG TPA: transposase [Bryobacteraceae bacterium]|nr:transposase [Bryobacteraceae bacterium]
MPRNARCVEAGLAYHVTQRGSNRQRVFYCASDYRMYLSLLREQLDDAGARVLAYCLMSNHVHLVVVPERADSLAVLFRRVHGRYSQYLNTRRRRSGHLWQQRYFSCPLSASHLWIALRYVEQNPCRAHLVAAAADYQWSSARAHLGLGADKTKLLDHDFWKRAGGLETWREMHDASDAPDRVLLLRRCTYAGRPFGDEEFVGRLEERFQRNWRRWGFEKLAAGA